MSNISCTEFVRRLEQTVESRRRADTFELRTHAADCAVCRAAWHDALLLDCAVADWQKSGKKIVPSVDLTDAILFHKTATQEPEISVSAIPFATTTTIDGDFNTEKEANGNRSVAHVAPAASFQSTPSRQWHGRRTAAVSVIIAAAAICVAVINGRLNQHKWQVEAIVGSVSPQPAAAHIAPPIIARNQQAGPIRIARSNPAPALPVAAEPVQVMVRDAETAYLGLASEAADAVAGATVLVPRPSPVSEAAKSGDEDDRWVDDVGRQFEPVSKNLSQAFQFLIKAVPADKAPAT